MHRFLPALVASLGLVCGGASAKDRLEQVALDHGSAAVKGKLKGRDSVQYAFSARPNQRLTISLATSNPSNYINVRRAEATEAVCQGALTSNVCKVQADTAVDYVVDVFLMRNAARRGERAEYTLSIGDQGAEPKAGADQPARR